MIQLQLRNAREENETLRKELDELKETDRLAAKFMTLAGEAIGLVDDAGCREAFWLRSKFKSAFRMIPD